MNVPLRQGEVTIDDRRFADEGVILPEMMQKVRKRLDGGAQADLERARANPYPFASTQRLGES